MVIRSAIRGAIRGPLRGALQDKWGADNGLSVSAPSAITFADGDQPYAMSSGEKIVLADSVGGDTTFTVAISVGGGGTLTLASTTGLTGSGDGTSSLSYSGSIANWNTALDGADIDGLSGETVSISVTMTGDTTTRVKTKTISVTSTAASSSQAAFGLLISLTKAA